MAVEQQQQQQQQQQRFPDIDDVSYQATDAELGKVKSHWKEMQVSFFDPTACLPHSSSPLRSLHTCSILQSPHSAPSYSNPPPSNSSLLPSLSVPHIPGPWHSDHEHFAGQAFFPANETDGDRAEGCARKHVDICCSIHSLGLMLSYQ